MTAKGKFELVEKIIIEHAAFDEVVSESQGTTRYLFTSEHEQMVWGLFAKQTAMIAHFFGSPINPGEYHTDEECGIDKSRFMVTWLKEMDNATYTILLFTDGYGEDLGVEVRFIRTI